LKYGIIVLFKSDVKPNNTIPSLTTFETMLLAYLISLITLFPTREKLAIETQPVEMSDSLTVYIFLADECVISQFFTIELERLYNMYRSQHVGFVGYFPNTTSTPEKIEAFGQKFGLTFTMLPDHDKSITKSFGITITPEIAIVDHRLDKVIYRGRIDDSYVRVGKRKLHPQSQDMEEMIELWLIHEAPVETVKTQAIGCFISFNPR
jgi:hypothetical protein